MKDAMMAANLVVAFIAGAVAVWRGMEVVSWVLGTWELANPESDVGVLLVGLAVLTFMLFNAKAIYEGWPGK